MRLEFIVSDSRATRIMKSVMEVASGTESEADLETLLEHELARAGPDADDLFDRIVVRVEHELISRVYAECDQVKTRAAVRLGINRNTLYKKLLQYRLIDAEQESG